MYTCEAFPDDWKQMMQLQDVFLLSFVRASMTVKRMIFGRMHKDTTTVKSSAADNASKELALRHLIFPR